MRRIVPSCLIAFFLVLAVAGCFAGLAGFIDGDVILAQRDALSQAAQAQPVIAVVAFVAAYIVGMSLALPLGGVLGLLAGLLFGTWLGLGLVVLAGTVSALAVFCVARGAFGESLRRRASPLHARVASAMQANAFSYLLFMRIVPLFPFFVVTLVAALLGVRTRIFVIATMLGKIPANFVYASLGQEIGRAADLGDLVTPQSVIGLGALGVLALAPAAYRYLRGRKVASAALN